jgi:hypothetical protein
MQFSRFQDDGFIEWLVMPAVGFANENTEQQGFVGNLHTNFLSLN